MLQIPSDTVTQITQVSSGALFIQFCTTMENIFPQLMQRIKIKWWIIKLLKTLCFSTCSLEIIQWNVHCFTPVDLVRSGESAWWRHQMETFSASLAICAGNSPVAGEFPTQRPVTRSFDVFFHLPLGWWFETHRAHYDVNVMEWHQGWF